MCGFSNVNMVQFIVSYHGVMSRLLISRTMVSEFDFSGYPIILGLSKTKLSWIADNQLQVINIFL